MVGCSNEGTTGGGVSLADALYTGTVNRTALIGISEEEAASGTATETIDGFTLQITSNKLASGTAGALIDVSISQSGSEYSASGEYIDTESGDALTIKETIRFTISSDGNTAEILEYTANVSGGGQSYSFTYKGTLTKQ